MNRVDFIVAYLRSFRSDVRGTVAIETAFMVPIMVWGYLSMFTYFDAFRQLTTQQKAAFTVSDLISRQATPLDAEFIDGAYSLFQNLSRIAGDPGIRVTVAKYNLAEEEYVVIWSRTRGKMTALQSLDIANWSDRLPVMPQDDQIIIVETTAAYKPVFNVGLQYDSINHFVFTRPRYAKQVCYIDVCDVPNPPVPEPSPEESA
ncbi:MAG: hypothetical protein AAGF27_01665 [Pseudomonadota bacterium]